MHRRKIRKLPPTISPSDAPFIFVVDDRKCGVFLVYGGCDLTLERPGGGETHTYTRGAVHTHKERYQVYSVSMINLYAVTMCVTGALLENIKRRKVRVSVVVRGENVGVVPSCAWLHSDQLHVDEYRFFFLI